MSASFFACIFGCASLFLTMTKAPAQETKPLLQSRTVTEAQANLQPFIFDGTNRGNMGQYFNGRTASTKSFVVGQFQLAPGSEPHPVHTHADDEILIVASGDGEIICDGKTTKVTSGSVMYTAPDVPHGIKNTGQTPLVFYFIKWVELGK